MGVSGAIPIRKRPGVGPYLVEERLVEWDGIIGYKIDRLFRNHHDFVTFYHDWCEPHGKVIISVGEGIDSSTDIGKFIMGILVQFAEWELKRMSQRRGDAKRRLIAQAYWNGGEVPFGYMPLKMGEHFELVPHPENAEIVRDMARWIIAGKSANALAKSLNERGILTGQDKPWRTQQVGPFLRSPRLRGYAVEGPRGKQVLVRGADGMPVRRAPIIDDEMWLALQAALDRNAGKKSAVHTRASGLLGVAFCALCGRKLYADVRSARPAHAYYVCPGRLEEGCRARSLPMDGLEMLAAWLFLAQVGRVEVLERVAVLGDDHAAAKAEVGRQITELTAERFQRGVVHENYDQMMASLQAEHARLAALPPEPPTITERPTGQTFAQLWHASDTEGRRQLMMRAGFQLRVARTGNAERITNRKKQAEAREDLERPAGHALAGARRAADPPGGLASIAAAGAPGHEPHGRL